MRVGIFGPLAGYHGPASGMREPTRPLGRLDGRLARFRVVSDRSRPRPLEAGLDGAEARQSWCVRAHAYAYTRARLRVGVPVSFRESCAPFRESTVNLWTAPPDSVVSTLHRGSGHRPSRSLPSFFDN